MPRTPEETTAAEVATAATAMATLVPTASAPMDADAPYTTLVPCKTLFAAICPALTHIWLVTIVTLCARGATYKRP